MPEDECQVKMVKFLIDSFPGVVQILLQAGVGVNAADLKGLTPLMTACMYGRTATAAYLLGMNAQNHLTDINGDTALHWAGNLNETQLSLSLVLFCIN